MIIIMKMGATKQEIGNIISRVEDQGFTAHISQGVERTIIGVIGDERPINAPEFEMLDGVDRVVPILQPFKLASRDFHPGNTVIKVKDIDIGGPEIVVIAGPCSVESREQILESAQAVKEAGAKLLRGGAYKPRTSPYSFQGLGQRGLELLAEASETTGLPVVTEVMSSQELNLVAQYSDVLQIGARNMQNYSLLHAVGDVQKPVLLKRGMSSTIEELLMAAEYILSHGNYQVMVCERGIRTFDSKYTRNTLDINAVPVLKKLTHLPVIVDPSHATGKWDLVNAASKAAVAAGADGLIIEVHPHPDKALSDGAQSLKPDTFMDLMHEVGRIAFAVDRVM
ncbi:MAG: 3-deoxy-7-phosphoheptulonate synthase [Chloroflexi bacterium]|nr:3-deoxy-7-phosphoheptulonate synthase [Chloroflexota bacterium]